MRCTVDRTWLLKALKLHGQVSDKSLHDSYKYLRMSIGSPEGLTLMSQTIDATLVTTTDCDTELLGRVAHISLRTDALLGLAEATSSHALGFQVQESRKVLSGVKVSWKGGGIVLPVARGVTFDYLEPDATSTEDISVADLSEALAKTEHLLSAEAADKSIHCGFLRLEKVEGGLRFVSTNNRAIAVFTVGLGPQFEGEPLHMAMATAQLLRNVLGTAKAEDTVKVQQRGTELAFWLPGRTRFFARTGVVGYPPYHQVVPKMAYRVLRVPTEAFLEVVHRGASIGDCSLTLSMQGDTMLRIELEGLCGGSKAHGIDTVPVVNHPGDFEPVTLHAPLTHRCLQRLKREEFVELVVYSPAHPIVLRPAEDEGRYWQAIMPIRRAS